MLFRSGLLTIAGMLPEDSYEIKLIDMNVTSLKAEHITWADLVLTSSMIAQEQSLRLVISQCNLLGVPIVVGGPHATSYHVDIEGVDHFILGEGEEIFPEFLADYENGRAGKLDRDFKKLWTKKERPVITDSTKAYCEHIETIMEDPEKL